MDKKPYPRRGHSKLRLQCDTEVYCTVLTNTVTCIQVLASKLTTNAKFQNLQDLNSRTFTRIFKYFQAPYLFSSTFKYLEVFIPNSSIFKDFSSTLWTLTYTYTSNVRTSQAQKSGSDTRIWLLVKLCIWWLITAADLNLSIEASKNLLCRVNRYSSLEPNRNSWMHTQPYSHTHTHRYTQLTLNLIEDQTFPAISQLSSAGRSTTPLQAFIVLNIDSLRTA